MFLCYPDAMKNLTVTIPESTYRVARIKAAEMGTSVSALVAAYLRGLEEDSSRFNRLEAQQNAIIAEIERFRAADRIPRDELHARALR